MWKKLTTKKLKVTHHRQLPGFCGPASLKMALSYFGHNFSEQQLAKWSKATAKEGTEHGGMVEAAKKAGAEVRAKEGGTIEDLEKYVNQLRLPVIVGWFDHDDDHYSVVVKVTGKWLYLADPQMRKTRRFAKGFFPKIWFDFVGDDSRIASWGWYMTVDYPNQLSR